MGQSKGWLANKISKTFSRAFKAKGLSDQTLNFRSKSVTHAATGFSTETTSNRQARQLPATAKLL